MHTCPVCGYDQLPAPPADYEICPSCGTEFGYTDFARSHDELRQQWLATGAPWFATWMTAPPHWDAYRQMVRAFGIVRIAAQAANDAAFVHVPSNSRVTSRSTLADFEGFELVDAWTR